MSCVCVFNRVQLFVTPWTVAHQAPLSVEIFRQEHWSWLPCSPLGDLPNPGIKLASLSSPALAVDSLSPSHLGSLKRFLVLLIVFLLLRIQTCTKGMVLGTDLLSLDLWVSESLFSSDSRGESCSLGLPEKGTPSV